MIHSSDLTSSVGAGHNGLALAARLQALGVKTLIIERNARVGDNWRNRYEVGSCEASSIAQKLTELYATVTLFAFPLLCV